MPRGVYDGLTGEDCRKLLLIAINDKLAKEGRLSNSQVYHNVILRGELEIDSYPHEPKVEKFSVAVAVGEPKAGKAPKKSKISFIEEHPVPDLSREKIEEAQSDVKLVTQAESRG